MNEILKHYQQLFSSLRTDKNKKRWSITTRHQAPHKPFLLLSILDQIASSNITKNFIEPSLNLIETFNNYWSLIMPIGSSASMSYPFYHLETSGFWHLVSTHGEQHQVGRTVSSVKRLLELYQGAKLDDDLFILLNNKEYRNDLRSILINHYFAPEIHQGLWDQSTINKQSEAYYYNIMEHPEEAPSMVAEAPSPIYQKVRDQGFRKAMLDYMNIVVQSVVFVF